MEANFTSMEVMEVKCMHLMGWVMNSIEGNEASLGFLVHLVSKQIGKPNEAPLPSMLFITQLIKCMCLASITSMEVNSASMVTCP